MTFRYRVDIEDTSGDVVASIENFTSLEFTKGLSIKGDYQLVLSGFDERIDLVEDDYLIRVWHADPAFDIDWTEVFTGIHKTFTDALLQNGNRTWTSYGPSLEEIVDKAYILYDSGTPEVSKSGAASTVMYAYVEENVGASATTANGRDVAHVNPISNAPDLGEGPAWAGGRARKPLMQVLKEIQQYSVEKSDQIDFRVNYLGSYTFQFQAGALGVDRTTDGLDPSTGKNGAGNTPVVFAAIQGNVQRMTRSKSRYNEANTIVALGQGIGAGRATAVSQDAASIAASSIAQREGTVNAADVDNDDLQEVADARLDETLAKEKLNFTPKKGAEVLWRDYFPGDFVTAEDFRDQTRRSKQIRSVTVRISGSGQRNERVTMEFVDV